MIIQIIKLCKVNFGKTSLMAASIFLTLKILVVAQITSLKQPN